MVGKLRGHRGRREDLGPAVSGVARRWRAGSHLRSLFVVRTDAVGGGAGSRRLTPPWPVWIAAEEGDQRVSEQVRPQCRGAASCWGGCDRRGRRGGAAARRSLRRAAATGCRHGRDGCAGRPDHSARTGVARWWTGSFPRPSVGGAVWAPRYRGAGVLGEQDLPGSIARAQKLAASYAALSDVPVVPTFEIIATTASAEPGADGDYSSESTVESLRPSV